MRATCLAICVVGAIVVSAVEAATAATPSLPQQLELAELQAAVGNTLKVRINAQGSLSYLAGPDIAPACSASGGAISPLGAELLVDCFLSTYPALLSELGEDLRSVPRSITQVTPQSQDGFQVIRVRQLYSGLPVKGGEFVFVGRNGRLISVLGKWFPSSIVPPGVLVNSKAALDAQAASVLGSIIRVDRFFDPSLGHPISRFELPSGMQVDWDENTGTEVRRFNPHDEYNPVGRSSSVGKYTVSFAQFAEPQTVNVSVDFHDLSGPYAEYCLDWGNHHEDGEPKLCTSNSATEDCGPNNGDPMCEVYLDSATGIYPDYPYDDLGIAMNAYFWVHDLSRFANNSWAAYDAFYEWDNYDSENLKVVLPTGSPCSSPGGACSRSFGSEYRIILPITNSTPRSLYSIAHEYGHFVHFMYDWNGDDDFENAVDEGFAEHNVLRYALFRSRETTNRPHDSGLPELIYSDSVWSETYDHRLESDLAQIHYFNGEAVPMPENTVFGPDYLTYTPSILKTPCNLTQLLEQQTCSQNADCLYGLECEGGKCESSKYRCGALLGNIYWILAFNRIRVPYGGKAAGIPILYQSTFADDPSFPVNVAFTYAISTMADGTSIAEFMDRVDERYLQFHLDGYIDSEEIDRIRKVMGVHCVGHYSERCSAWHKTVGQLRPVAMTGWRSFDAGHKEHFVRAETMTLSGSPSFAGFGTPDGLGYVRLDSPDDKVCFKPAFPLNGNYRIAGALRGSGSCSTYDLFVTIDENDPITWTIDGNCGEWTFATGPLFTNVLASGHEVCIRYKDDIVDIDAVLLRNE